MSKFLKVEVSRSESTDLYLRVPDDFDPMRLHSHWQMADIIQRAVKETITDGEWVDDGGRIEVQGWSEVSDEEAANYLGFDVETKKKVGRYV